jgi:hypothetical protein
VTATEATRLTALLGAVEMALVRRDPVAGPLLAQAARAAEGLPPGELLAAAAAVVRAADVTGTGPDAAAARKVAQALCRAAAQTCQAALLAVA